MTTHLWNTRRCIKYKGYRTGDQAMGVIRYLQQHHGAGDQMETMCPWCGRWHILSPGIARYKGYRSTVAMIADLPPLFEPTAADPARSNGSYARSRT